LRFCELALCIMQMLIISRINNIFLCKKLGDKSFFYYNGNGICYIYVWLQTERRCIDER
jgi:hypothetical protein